MINRNRTWFVFLSLAIVIPNILIVTLLVGLSTSRAASSQSPMATAINPSQYFPLQVDNQWVYSWTNSIYAPSPIIETVVVTEQTDSQYTFHAYHNQADGQFSISTSSGYRWTSYWTTGSNPFPLPMYMVLHYLNVPSNHIIVPDRR